MAKDPTKTDPAGTDPEELDPEETGEGTPDDGPDPDGADPQDQDGDDDGDGEENPELAKLRRKNARRERELRKAQAELAELRKKQGDGEGAPEESAEVKANRKLVRASARTALAAAGVTEREDQATVLGMINLSDIDVDDNGDPDEDEIQDRIDVLRRVFGAPQGAGGGRPPRTPRVNPKDRGSGGGTADPDAARFARILRGGR